MVAHTRSMSVIGLGYVGAVCAVCWARQGLDVIGVDVDESKVDRLAEGHSPILEPGLGDETRAQVDAGRLTARTDLASAVHETELTMICVGTPSQRNGRLGLRFVERVCREIGEALRDKDDWHLVVLRSTVLPGTTREVVLPILEASSGKRAGVDFGLVFNPEFLREGTAIEDFYSPPKTVVGESDERSGRSMSDLYEGIGAPAIRTSFEAAEMVKYADNSWHATKVAFANEIGSVCDSVGVSGAEVMEIFCQDRKLNISPAYLRPGFAFGGSCLPKDVRALCYRARELDLELPLLSSLLPSNARQIDRAFDRIRECSGARVGILGISFKAGTDDLRESPQIEIIERLLGKGYEVKIYDRNVSLSRIQGANRQYLLDRIPHVSNLIVDDLEVVVEKSEIVVIGNQSSEFEGVASRLVPGQELIDLTGMLNLPPSSRAMDEAR